MKMGFELLTLATEAEKTSSIYIPYHFNLFVFNLYSKIGTPDEGLEPATLRLKV